MHLPLRKILRRLWSVLCVRVLWTFVERFSRDLFAQPQRQPSRAALGGRVHGSVMRGLPIEIDPGLPAVLVPGLLQELDLVRRRDAEAIQS